MRGHRPFRLNSSGARLGLASLVAATLACSVIGGLFGTTQEPAERVSTLEAELAQARQTASAAGRDTGASSVGESPTAEAAGSIVEDFDSGTQAFAGLPGVEIGGGGLLLGPFDRCATDVGNFDQEVDCLAPCQTCGRDLQEYVLKTSFRLEEGLSDREFGVMLRFVDEGIAGQLDSPDYLLALGFDLYHNRWRAYLHRPNEIEPWEQIKSDRAGFLGADRFNQLEVRATEAGRRIDVSLNGARILRLTGDAPQPGETLVEPWQDSGAVGLLGLGRGVQARYDYFELRPRR